MGNFSWVCKGCGEELCCPEWVRIDDHVGVYNGYGVVVMEGGREWDVFDRENPNETFTRCPNAWHAACYDGASEALREQVAEIPSSSAPDQGFGDPQRCFKPPEGTPLEAHSWTEPWADGYPSEDEVEEEPW